MCPIWAGLKAQSCEIGLHASSLFSPLWLQAEQQKKVCCHNFTNVARAGKKQQIWQRTSLWPTGCEQSEIISISSLPQTVSAKIANILGNYMLRLCSNFCLFYKLICLHFLELECMLWCGRVGFGLGIRRVVAITLLAPMHCCKNNVSATVGG